MSRSLLGKSAPDFGLADTAGRVHRPADYRSQWLLLVFHRHLR